jgi:hypothetical protein
MVSKAIPFVLALLGSAAFAVGSPIEDHLDCAMVRAARTIASQCGEKAMAWSEFKKKL